jgi:DNA (cytosine-5)-methyltransferase 1
VISLFGPGAVTVCDLFAGAGGSSTGLEQAGWRVIWAANHWPEAVAVHARNHPLTEHVVQDLHQAVWDDVPAPDVVWASPSCKGSSQAATRNLVNGKRGSGRKADAHRTTAWAVVDAAETLRPRGLIVENVTCFQTWKLFDVWCAALRKLGYTLTLHLVDAADLGVPQDRPRLIVLGGLGRRLGLPKPQARRSVARDVVRLSEGRWRDVRDCAAGVQRRVKRGAGRGHGKTWLTQSVTGHAGRSLDRTLPVVTTQHQLGLVKNAGSRTLYRPFMLSEYAAGMGFPSTYDWNGVGVSKGSEMLGNAVCPPVARWIAQQVEAQL